MEKNKPHFGFNDMFFRVVKSKLFLRNFLSLMGILTVIFLIFAFSLFAQSRTTIKNEFTAASRYALEKTAEDIDNHINDVKYIIATLDTNNIIRSFFYSKNPERVYSDYQIKIQEILKAYVYGFPSIDSIYLYSIDNGIILSHELQSNPRFFDDSNWIDPMTEAEDGFFIFFRKKADAYPFLLTIAKKLSIDGHPAVIVVNVNLHNHSALKKITETPYQEIYIISDEGDLVFRNEQDDLFESIELIPELKHYRSDPGFFTDLVEDESPYVISQKSSGKHPWSFVLITHLQEYTARVSGLRALVVTIAFCVFFAAFLLVFLLCLQIVRPTFELIHLLDHAEYPFEKDLFSSREIEYIAAKITGYIQQNEALSTELNSRLNILNQTKLLALQAQINPHFLFNTLNMIHIQECEALGYNNRIPKLTLDLSRLLHYAIESTDLSPLKTELDYAKMYVNILQNRFNGQPKVIFEIDESVMQVKVPKLFIQPIIENAVFHGLSDNMDENSALMIRCKCLYSHCELTVSDNGVGMSPETLQQLRDMLQETVPLQNNIGVKNVYTRMKLLYGDEFTMLIESAPGQGSSFIFHFPMQE